jgi:hypothetical protein
VSHGSGFSRAVSPMSLDSLASEGRTISGMTPFFCVEYPLAR